MSAMREITDVMLPLEGTISPGAAEEAVAVSGLLHVVLQVTPTPVCAEVHLHARLVGASGTGRTTGQRYVLDGTATLQQQIPREPPAPAPFTVFFRVAWPP